MRTWRLPQCDRRRAARALLLTIALGGTAAAARPEEAETPLLGPLRIRDMTPFSILRLDMLPGPDMSALTHGWAFEVNFSHANTFVKSGNVEDYLRQRNRRTPLTRADVQAIYALPGDAFYFDGAIGIVTLTGHHAFSKRWSAFATLPVHYYRGGFLDSTIEGFHRRLGFDDAGRNLVARNRLQLVMKVDGEKFSLLRVPAPAGLSDPVLGGRYFARPAPGWHLVGEVAVKIPLGDRHKYFSSGSVDGGLQLTVQRQLRRQAFYLVWSEIWLGGNDILPGSTRPRIPTVTAAWEHRLSRRSSFLLQMTASQGVFEDTSARDLLRTKLQVSGGIRRRQGPRIYTFALTENVATFNNTPDIGFHVGSAWLFPSRAGAGGRTEGR